MKQQSPEAQGKFLKKIASLVIEEPYKHLTEEDIEPDTTHRCQNVLTIFETFQKHKKILESWAWFPQTNPKPHHPSFYKE